MMAWGCKVLPRWRDARRRRRHRGDRARAVMRTGGAMDLARGACRDHCRGEAGSTPPHWHPRGARRGTLGSGFGFQVQGLGFS